MDFLIYFSGHNHGYTRYSSLDHSFHQITTGCFSNTRPYAQEPEPHKIPTPSPTKRDLSEASPEERIQMKTIAKNLFGEEMIRVQLNREHICEVHINGQKMEIYVRSPSWKLLDKFRVCSKFRGFNSDKRE